jgi:hypothetical protein
VGVDWLVTLATKLSLLNLYWSSCLAARKAEIIMRILLAFDREYRLYMEAIAEAMRTFRSNVEVALTDSGNLESEVDRFDPQLVFSTSHISSNPVDPKVTASAELSPEPSQPSRFRLGERHWESTNPTLGEILSVVDETRSLHMTSHEEGSADT